jgi:RNA recognition motif-containing protein
LNGCEIENRVITASIRPHAPADSGPMEVYVNGFDYATDSHSLCTAFEKYGRVKKVTLPRDQCTGQLRGYGFVEFYTHVDAVSAIQNMNGTKLDGRTIHVEEARSRSNPIGKTIVIQDHPPNLHL